MKNMTFRGLKIFFKDKSGIFFSLLGVIIIFCLFIFFIGDSMTKDLDFLDNAKYVMDSWVVSGMLASCAITTSMGAYSVMVSDKEHKCIKDFYVSPLKKSSIVAGYMFTGLIISIVMSIVTFIFGEIYIVANGGKVASFVVIFKVLGVILLSSFASSAIICFVISFIKTSGAYTTISIILGSLIGFLVGAYICIGDLPSGVQWVVKIFPCAHAAVLFRQFLMADGMTTGFADMPDNVLTDFKEYVGVSFKYGDWNANVLFHVLILIGTGIIFYLLAIINMSRKVKEY